MIDTAPTEGVPGRKLFEVVYGSHAHGTATPTSDVDVRGVYLLPDNAFLGLGRAKTTWERKSEDRVFWEIGHFCQLLLKGNPNLVGMLFTPADCVITTSAILTGMPVATKFLSTSMVTAYMGWIHREMHDIGEHYDAAEGRFKGVSSKRLSHVPRLIFELESVFRSDFLEVRPTGAKREAIMAIKTGQMPFVDAVAYCGDLLLGLEVLAENPPYPPPEPPFAETEAWLLETRRLYGGRYADPVDDPDAGS